MNSKTIRTFFAIKLPPLTLEQLEIGLSDFKRSNPKHIKWVPANAMHITLKFIGFFNSDHLPKIQEILEKQLTGSGRVNFTIDKPGVFPNHRNPKTIWLGLNKTNRISDLEQIINSSTNNLGYKCEQREFSPHITVGRIRNSVRQEIRTRIGQKFIEYKFSKIDHVNIYRLSFIISELTPRGPMYRTLFEIVL